MAAGLLQRDGEVGDEQQVVVAQDYFLNVTVPKAETGRPRRIEVTGG